MKRLILLLFPILTSCAAVDAMLMSKFDPSEYRMITEIRANAQMFKTECDNYLLSKPNAIEMANQTNLFMLYSEHIPRNTDSYNASKSLNEIAQGLSEKYVKGDKVSPMFCKLKFEGIEHSADTMQHVLGNRPR